MYLWIEKKTSTFPFNVYHFMAHLFKCVPTFAVCVPTSEYLGCMFESID